MNMQEKIDLKRTCLAGTFLFGRVNRGRYTYRAGFITVSKFQYNLQQSVCDCVSSMYL
jgi:hypothetical protein